MCFEFKINTNGFSAKTQWYNILIFRRKKRTYIVHPIDDLLKLSSASHQATASTLKRQNTFNIDVNESPSSYYARLMIGGPASDFYYFQSEKQMCGILTCSKNILWSSFKCQGKATCFIIFIFDWPLLLAKFTFLKTRSMGHPELMSTKSTSV